MSANETSECYLTWNEDGTHLQCSVSHDDRSACVLSIWDETEDDYRPTIPCDVASCEEAAVGRAFLIGYEDGNSAYGCLDHLDSAVVAFQNGAWRGALLDIRHLDSGEMESIERMATPTGILRAMGATS